MLRERSVGETLWEAVLPAELRELPAELARVDAILDADRFLAPFRSRLTARTGRPTIAIETYLRLMYLKHRYGLGYETLCREVADSFTWRRFCRIALDGRVPDPSTLMKLTKRLGPAVLEELNAELLSLAVERRVVRSRRLRVDTTVVEADIRNPTDSGLCAHAVSRLTRLGKRIKAAGLTFVKENGEPCKGYRLTKEGVGEMLDQGLDLVADPGRFCAYHARSEIERYEMAVRGGSYSPSRVKAEHEAERKRVEQQMPRDIVLAGYALIRSLVNAKLPTSPPEPDVRRVALGVYLASVMCAPPDERMRFINSLLPRSLRTRDDIEQIAEMQLQDTIESLDPAERSRVWELLQSLRLAGT